QNESPHDTLAELSLGNHQRSQPFGRDRQSLDGLLRIGVDQRWPAGELSELAHEPPGVMGNDRYSSRLLALADLDCARQDDGEAVTRLTDFHQRLACAIRSNRAKPAQSLDVG